MRLDLTSGNSKIVNPQTYIRLTRMLCVFERKALMEPLYGQVRADHSHDRWFAKLKTLFAAIGVVRQPPDPRQ